MLTPIGGIFEDRNGDKWKLLKRKGHLALWQKSSTGTYQILLRESDTTDSEPDFLMSKETRDFDKVSIIFDKVCKLLK